MKVLSPEEMRLMDENCIRHYGISGQILMENAASAAMNHIIKTYETEKILLICGSGNNGGDGLALARLLYSCGKSVEVILCGSTDRMSEETGSNLKSLMKLSLPLHLNPPGEKRKILFQRAELIVDALFGTGLNRAVRGAQEELIHEMNQCPSPVVSLDIPSGLDGGSAEVLGSAVKADSTVCFAAPLLGNIRSPGFKYNGGLVCGRISFPPELYSNPDYQTELNIPPPLAERDPLGYKNSFGKVLIIGGGGDYSGAPALAAAAAYRSGAGYVTAAVPKSMSRVISAYSAETVTRGLSETDEGTIAEENFNQIMELSEGQDALLIGPGMTRNPGTIRLIQRLIPLISVPLVIDADALTAIAANPDLTRMRKALTVLTPHKGEQMRLGAGGNEALEKMYGVHCVYKGPRSTIAYPDGRQFINLTGNEALGTAGSGDALAGMITGLLAGEKGNADALRKAVLLHGLAADLYDGATDSFKASDIIDILPRCFRTYRENYRELSDSFYGRLEMIH